MPDYNLILNAVFAAAVIIAAVPFLRSKRKDAVIAEQKQVIESHEKRISALERDLVGAQERANESAERVQDCEVRLAAVKAAYDEQGRYTAAPAVQHFEELLIEHRSAVAERHKLMIDTLGQMARTLEQMQTQMPNPGPA